MPDVDTSFTPRTSDLPHNLLLQFRRLALLPQPRRVLHAIPQRPSIFILTALHPTARHLIAAVSGAFTEEAQIAKDLELTERLAEATRKTRAKQEAEDHAYRYWET